MDDELPASQLSIPEKLDTLQSAIRQYSLQASKGRIRVDKSSSVAASMMCNLIHQFKAESARPREEAAAGGAAPPSSEEALLKKMKIIYMAQCGEDPTPLRGVIESAIDLSEVEIVATDYAGFRNQIHGYRPAEVEAIIASASRRATAVIEMGDQIPGISEQAIGRLDAVARKYLQDKKGWPPEDIECVARCYKNERRIHNDEGDGVQNAIKILVLVEKYKEGKQSSKEVLEEIQKIYQAEEARSIANATLPILKKVVVSKLGRLHTDMAQIIGVVDCTLRSTTFSTNFFREKISVASTEVPATAMLPILPDPRTAAGFNTFLLHCVELFNPETNGYLGPDHAEVITSAREFVLRTSDPYLADARRAVSQIIVVIADLKLALARCDGGEEEKTTFLKKAVTNIKEIFYQEGYRNVQNRDRDPENHSTLYELMRKTFEDVLKEGEVVVDAAKPLPLDQLETALRVAFEGRARAGAAVDAGGGSMGFSCHPR